ncbi:MAG: hypothetical protein HQK57_12230 [Deltaproteobacteria bacterium]|nr:hypothetical protein [Deltaproteobacteria bacterium]
MTAWLQHRGEPVSRKRVRRLIRLMGFEVIYPISFSTRYNYTKTA